METQQGEGLTFEAATSVQLKKKKTQKLQNKKRLAGEETEAMKRVGSLMVKEKKNVITKKKRM